MSTIVIEQREKDKRISAILTILFHALLVILFLYFGLQQPNPLPEEQGIELSFEDAGGLTGGNPDPNPGSPQESATPVTAPSQPEDVATDDASEVEMPKPVKPQPKPPKPETPKPPKPNPNALFNPSTNPSTNPTTGPPGGNKEPGTQPGGGGIGDFSGKGFNGRLVGRGFMKGPSITEKPNEGGKVALDIFVDRNGKVTRVAFNLDRSTTTSQVLFNLAKKAALQCTFSAKPDGPAEQKGEMTFVFILE
ncbi:MAG: hypothetical protein JNL52_01675 [Flavobacteriales bacterium]|nr:hypothetical protein [Flavobacteriales bacterium]